MRMSGSSWKDGTTTDVEVRWSVTIGLARWERMKR
jgi:hypothetical protein